MPPELAATLTQFGVAGLIGWMWLTERRTGAERERQITEAHAMIHRVAEDRTALLDALRDCARAMVALECAQRALADLVRAQAPAPAPTPPRPRDSMGPCEPRPVDSSR